MNKTHEAVRSDCVHLRTSKSGDTEKRLEEEWREEIGIFPPQTGSEGLMTRF